jgi:hypothetical protein
MKLLNNRSVQYVVDAYTAVNSLNKTGTAIDNETASNVDSERVV